MIPARFLAQVWEPVDMYPGQSWSVMTSRWMVSYNTFVLDMVLGQTGLKIKIILIIYCRQTCQLMSSVVPPVVRNTCLLVGVTIV